MRISRAIRQAAEECLEVWALCNTPAQTGGYSLGDIFCRALISHIVGDQDPNYAGESEAAYRLLGRVDGFFGHQLQGGAAAWAYHRVLEISQLENASDLIYQALLSIASGGKASSKEEQRVIDILCALKSTQRIYDFFEMETTE
jgi:hypothetical protein